MMSWSRPAAAITFSTTGPAAVKGVALAPPRRSSPATSSLLRLAGTGAAGANVVDNLPAYLALEPVAAGSRQRVVALLIGGNLGPLITIWASLATLLWRDRCTTAGVTVSAWRFAGHGMILVPLLLVGATAALAAASQHG